MNIVVLKVRYKKGGKNWEFYIIIVIIFFLLILCKL